VRRRVIFSRCQILIRIYLNYSHLSLCLPLTFRRYGSVALCRGGTRFCTRDALQGYAVNTLFSRWQKPWHQEGDPGGSRGRPVAPDTNLSSLVTLLSHRGRQWPIPTC
jgi:hypothetical protein